MFTEPLDATLDNPWAPFEDRLAFDWAFYHYVKMQSSEANIVEGLDLWRAAKIKESRNGDIPWGNADDLYNTINSIQAGHAPWRSYKFRYTGPKPQTPPQWMNETYDLNLRDVLIVLEQQLATTGFDSKFDYAPYQEYDPNHDRVYSNLMSGAWAFDEAACIAPFIQ